MNAHELHDLAVELNALGWRVFPVKADKTPAITAFLGSEPFTPRGLQRMPWHRASHLGCALAPHHVILDVDVKNGANGMRHLEQLQDHYGPLPATRQQRTRSGGIHLLFRSEVPLGKGAPRNPILPNGQPAAIDIVRFGFPYAVIYDPDFLRVSPADVLEIPSSWQALFAKKRTVWRESSRPEEGRSDSAPLAPSVEQMLQRLRGAR